MIEWQKKHEKKDFTRIAFLFEEVGKIEKRTRSQIQKK